MNQPADTQNRRQWAQDETMKLGLGEAEFDAADKNHDGKLDLLNIKQD
jgi:hypothetical protein